MLSSKGDAKNEARFAARLDVLAERVDTLAATVATTASAMAKKDGEIASLRKDLQARDEAVQALAAQARLASQAPAAGAAADPNELRSLRNAVAALTKDRAEGGGSSPQLEELATRVGFIAQRVETLSTTVSTTAAGNADPAVTLRVDALEAELGSLKAQAPQGAVEPDRPSEELQAMLATLRAQIEALGGIRAGVPTEQLDERFAETEQALAQLSERLDTIAESASSAASELNERDDEFAALHRHFTESSARVESVAEDIREALAAFPDPSSSMLDDLAARVEQVETAAREAAETRERRTGELDRRIDVIDERVATVATEVARAKTLWPVALRSLEARLDDVSRARKPETTAFIPDAESSPDPADESDDLLAGLRDSLHAMETVAAEMARASDALSPPEGESENDATADRETPIAVGGATIVPLRTGEP